MVSFQCHACGDVVKKPKLDQHRGRCHTGFDCIDCHTTFNGPAEYKGHTQCISEAEKYQKNLYKGPKTTAAPPRNNYPPPPIDNSIPSRPSWATQGRGGYGYGAGWGRSRTSATGANDTPLGTPARNSPVPPPPPKTSIIHQVKTDVQKPPEVPKAATDNSNPLGKKEKDKKRKSTIVDEDMATATKSSHVNGDEPRSKKAKIANDAVTTNPASIPLPVSPVRSVDQHRKEKKSTKDNKHGDNDEKKNKRRESKKSKLDGTDGKDIEMSAPIDNEMKEERKHKKSKKDKREKDGESREESNGKSKKLQRDVVDSGTNGPVDKELKETVDRKSKQSKKEKREKHDESREEPSETSKKRKRDVVEVDGKGEGEVGETKSKGRKGDANAMEVDSPSGKSKIGKNEKVTKVKKDKKVRAPDFVAETTL